MKFFYDGLVLFEILSGFSKEIVQYAVVALRVVKASLASVAAMEATRGEHAPTDEGGY